MKHVYVCHAETIEVSTHNRNSHAEGECTILVNRTTVFACICAVVWRMARKVPYLVFYMALPKITFIPHNVARFNKWTAIGWIGRIRLSRHGRNYVKDYVNQLRWNQDQLSPSEGWTKGVIQFICRAGSRN